MHSAGCPALSIARWRQSSGQIPSDCRCRSIQPSAAGMRKILKRSPTWLKARTSCSGVFSSWCRPDAEDLTTSCLQKSSKPFSPGCMSSRGAPSSISKPRKPSIIGAMCCNNRWLSQNGRASVPNAAEKVIDTIGRAPRGLNDGKGFVFISHLGEVFPSGFLPLSAGNVRTESLSAIYRESPIFQQLRDPSQLAGKCGACEFKHVCGGSRARAYALMGDPLAEEPCCSYVPKNYSLEAIELGHRRPSSSTPHPESV